MDEKEAPRVTQAIVLYLHALHGGSQEAFAAAAGVGRNTISLAERGRRSMQRTTLYALAAAVGVTRPELNAHLALARAAVARKQRRSAADDLPVEVAAIAATLASDAAHVTLEIVRLLGRSFAPLARHPPEWRPAPPAVADRREAPALRARLERYSAADRRFLVEEVEEFHRWALAELLAEESVDIAAENPQGAVELAELAVLVAELVQGEERWRARLKGYCWFALASARRVCNDLKGAEEASATAWPLWRAGAGGDPGLLNEARVLGLEASLHRAQRRFDCALELLEQALAVDRGEERIYLLINQATTLDYRGDLEAALEILQRVEPLLDAECAPRLAFAAASNLVNLLTELERHEEAERKLPRVQALAERAAKDLDRVRLQWVRGRVAAGLGREAEGLALLEQVGRELTRRDLPYDRALVSLELAVLHLERGRSREVKVLVQEMAPVFTSQGIHREALGALKLFRQAVEQERATAELARRVVDYLHRARHNPELPFAAGPERGEPDGRKDRTR